MTSTEQLVRPKDKKDEAGTAPAPPERRIAWPEEAPASGTAAAAPAPPMPSNGISAPFNVKVTRGAGPAVPARTGDRIGTEKRGTAASGLSAADRDSSKAKAAAGGANGANGPTGGVDAPYGAAAAPVTEAPTLAQPLSTSEMPIAGTSVELEAADPYAAAEVYFNTAGALLKTVQNDDALLQQDHRFALAAATRVAKDTAALGTPSTAKKLKDEIWKRYGITDVTQVGSVMAEHGKEAEAALQFAEGTVTKGNAAVPLIDGTYHEAETVKATVGKMTGKRSMQHTKERVAAYDKDRIDPRKHRERFAQFGEASTLVRTVGAHVRESKLSGSELTLRVGQFKQFRERALKAGTGGAGLTKKIGNAIGGKIAGALTGGIYRPESKTTDGGHSVELDHSHGLIWNRLKAEFATLSALRNSKAYGRATGFHAGLQTFMLVLRELRDFVGTLSIWLGVASVFAPPVVPFAVLAGLIVIALSALRAVLGTILLSWSVVQRAVMSNWRAKNTMNAQIVQQGSELLGDAAQVVAPSVAATAGNAGAMAGSFNTTTQQVGAGGFSKLAGTSQATADIGLRIGQNVVNKAVGLGAGAVAPGLVGVGIGELAPDQARRGNASRNAVSHLADRPEAPKPQLTRAPGILPGTKASAPAARTPEWIDKSQKSLVTSTKDVTATLVKTHANKMMEFSVKTQNLITETRAGKDAAATAESKTATVPQMSAPDNAGRLGEAKSALASVTEAAESSAAVAKRLSDPAALRSDLEADAAGGGE